MNKESRRSRVLILVSILFACAACIAVVHTPSIAPGVIAALVIIILGAVAASRELCRKPHDEALRSSIALALDSLRDSIVRWEDFRHSAARDTQADCLIRRQALLDDNSNNPDIRNFHRELRTSKRFLKRVDSVLERPRVPISSLERILHIADERSERLSDAWGRARKAALTMGPEAA